MDGEASPIKICVLFDKKGATDWVAGFVLEDKL